MPESVRQDLHTAEEQAEEHEPDADDCPDKVMDSEAHWRAVIRWKRFWKTIRISP